MLNIKTPVIYIFIAGLTCAATFSNAQTGDKSILIRQIDSILRSQVKDQKIPGAVIEIKKGDEVIYKQAYGYAQKFNYRHQPLAKPERMTTEHLFDIASLTKVIGTTTSIMLLVDKGLIRVDDPVGKYIKAFAAPDKAGITIRHLLTHTAGLYEWYPMFYRAHNKQETFKLIGELPSPLNPPPGCVFHPRCPLANARCREEVPQLQLLHGRQVACHAVEEGRAA